MAMRWLHFRVDEQLLERARLAAAADRRSLSNWVALTIERALPGAPEPSPASQDDAVTHL
jgi:hypothetical protein